MTNFLSQLNRFLFQGFHRQTAGQLLIGAIKTSFRPAAADGPLHAADYPRLGPKGL